MRSRDPGIDLILGVTRNEQIITTRDAATHKREHRTIRLVGSAHLRPRSTN